MSSKQSLSIRRIQLPQLLLQRFIRDFNEILNHYSEENKISITKHLINVVELQRKYLIEQDASSFLEYRELELSLLEKYGKALKPYRDKKFYIFFDSELVLSGKGIYSEQEYNSLSSDEQKLSLNDMKKFLITANNALRRELEQLFFNNVGTQNSVNDNKELLLNGKPKDETDKEVTKARQLLAVYYLLKTIGIEHRESNSVSAIARFIHLVTGTKFSTIQNSEIYKKYLLMPNYKTGESLIRDLKYIRSFFQDAGLAGALKEIDDEIMRSINDLPFAMRKKWKN